METVFLDYAPTGIGIGDIISFVSALLSTDKNFILLVPVDTAHKLKTVLHIFCIDPNRIRVHEVEKLSITPVYSGLYSKIFSPYFTVENVNIGNRPFTPRQLGHRLYEKKRPAIGLCCYRNKFIRTPGVPRNVDVNVLNYKTYHSQLKTTPWPTIRHYPIEIYSKVFELINETGYDVLNFDSEAFSLEDKIYLMNEFCDAVITYEGGLAHMAHLLKIPTIIIPWSHDMQGRIDPNLNRNQINLIHLDQATYVCENVNEILSWTPDELCNRIDGLYEQNNNNFFFTRPVEFNEGLSVIKLWNNGNEDEYIRIGATADDIAFFKRFNLPERNGFAGNPVQTWYPVGADGEVT